MVPARGFVGGVVEKIFIVIPVHRKVIIEAQPRKIGVVEFECKALSVGFGFVYIGGFLS